MNFHQFFSKPFKTKGLGLVSRLEFLVFAIPESFHLLSLSQAELQCTTQDVQICLKREEEVEQPQPDLQEEQEEQELDNEEIEQQQPEEVVEEQEEVEEVKEEDSVTCQVVPQQKCEVVDVERCREKPVCVDMVRTVRRTVCPDSEDPEEQEKSP